MATMPPTPEALIAHGDFLRGLARELLGDEHRAEDIVQQAYMRAMNIPAPGGLRAWLATVVRRLALNDRRAEARRAGREEAAARPAAVPSTADIVERESARREVVDAVLGLAEPYRSTVVLRYFESLSPSEIGSRLDISSSTVRTRLQRAHEMLRDHMDRTYRGQRARWAGLLVPLARPLPPIPPLAWSTLLMKKILVGAAAASLLIVGWLVVNAFGAPLRPGSDTPLDVTPITSATGEVQPTAATRIELAEAGRTAADPGDPATSPSYLAALAGFRGRVVDSAGTPVAGSGVELFRLALDAVLQGSAPGHAAPSLRAGEATTGPDGSFEISSVRPRGLFLLRAGLGTNDPTTRVVQRAPEPGEMVDLGDVTLASLAALTGRVVDALGEPVAGAEVLAIDFPPPFLTLAPVYAFDPDGALLLREGQGPTRVVELPGWVAGLLDSLPIPGTSTDSEGSFTLTGIPAGTTALAVVATGHQPLLRPGVVVPEEGDHLGTVQLTSGHRLLGRVVDAAGDPVPGAEVLAAPNNPIAPADFAGPPLTTDAQGRFSAGGFPPGRVNLAARRGPGHRWVATEPRALAGDIEIVLPGTHDVTLLLISNDGLPITLPRPTLFAGRGAGLPELSALGLASEVVLGERLERQGPRLRIRDLEPGWYTVRVSDPAHAVAVMQFELGSGLTSDLQLRLDARADLSIRAVDATGAPVAGATVFASPPPSPEWPVAMPMPCGVTDASGSIALDQVPGATVSVIASHPRFGQAEGQASRGAQNTITFEEVGAIAGVVHAGGRAVDAGRWSILLLPPATGGLPVFPPVTRPDSDGNFRFPALQPGSYRVRAVDSLDMMLTPATAVELARYSWMPSPRVIEVDVRGGREEEVRLDISDPETTDEPGARVTGTVMIDGRPGNGMVVVAQMGPSREPEMSTVDPNGRFDLGHIAVGTCYVSTFDIEQRSFADNQPHMMWSGWVEVSAGADRELAIDVQTGTLSGTILDNEGQPAAEVWVEARGALSTPGPEEGVPLSSRYVVQADRDGRFEITGVAPGTWQIGARPYGAREMHGTQNDIVVQPGQRRADVRIRFDR